jgi:hypothetical protein
VMVLNMCAINAWMFLLDHGEEAAPPSGSNSQKDVELMKIADELLDRLAKMYETEQAPTDSFYADRASAKSVSDWYGHDVGVLVPPNAHVRRFWWDFLERRTHHGKAKKNKS